MRNNNKNSINEVITEIHKRMTGPKMRKEYYAWRIIVYEYGAIDIQIQEYPQSNWYCWLSLTSIEKYQNWLEETK